MNEQLPVQIKNRYKGFFREMNSLLAAGSPVILKWAQVYQKNSGLASSIAYETDQFIRA